jgi:hypothetical protein
MKAVVAGDERYQQPDVDSPPSKLYSFAQLLITIKNKIAKNPRRFSIHSFLT